MDRFAGGGDNPHRLTKFATIFDTTCTHRSSELSVYETFIINTLARQRSGVDATDIVRAGSCASGHTAAFRLGACTSPG